MKALLINGARPTADQYDLQVQNSINYQGWGLANLTTSIPTNAVGSGGISKIFFDQSPTNALATGQSRTFSVTVKPEAANSPLRMTLAWTDPPKSSAPANSDRKSTRLNSRHLPLSR